MVKNQSIYKGACIISKQLSEGIFLSDLFYLQRLFRIIFAQNDILGSEVPIYPVLILDLLICIRSGNQPSPLRLAPCDTCWLGA
jgi:hypothetical protein